MKVERYIPDDIIKTIGGYLRTKEVERWRQCNRAIRKILKDKQTSKLMGSQKAHYYEMKNCLEEYKTGLNVSLMGTGKSFIGGALAKTFLKLKELKEKKEAEIMVLCTKTLVSVWKKIGEIFKIKISVYTYGQISNKRSKLKLLEYKNDKYIISNKLEDKIKNGLMLIIDECHYLKNKSSRFNAIMTILSCLYKYDCWSLFLSATPIDCIKQIPQYMRLLGIMKEENLQTINPITGINEIKGFMQILKACKLDEDTSDLFIDKFLKNKNKTLS